MVDADILALLIQRSCELLSSHCVGDIDVKVR
jgi:hypothetical protein